MKKNILLSVLILFTIHCSLFTASAQSWQVMMDSTNYYQGKQDFQTALIWAQKALPIAEKEFGENDTNYTSTLGSIAELFYYSGKLDSAINYQKIQLKSYRVLYIKDHFNLAASIGNLAYFYDKMGNNEEAEPLYKEALEMQRRIFKADHPDLAYSINNLARFYNSIGRYDKAEPYFMEALSLFKKLYKKDNIELAGFLDNIAGFSVSKGKLDEAELYYFESLEMRRRLFNNDNPELATGINNMAYIYQVRGKFNEAESLFKEAIEMRKRLFNSIHPDLISSINNLAGLYYNYGMYSEAEPLFLEIIGLYKKINITDDAQYAFYLNNLGMYYNAIGRYSEAEPLIKNALDIRRHIYKTGHPDLAVTIGNLAYFYQLIGKYSDAEPLLLESYEMIKQLYKSDHPQLAKIINQLGLYYCEIGRYSEAEHLLKESLEIRRHLFKSDNIELATSINDLAGFYIDRGKYIESEILLKEAIDMRRRIYKSDNKNLAISINNLAILYKRLGRFDEAEPLYKEALEMRRRLFKVDHYDLSISINNMAMFYNDRARYNEAEPLYKEALEMTKRIFKNNNPKIAKIIYNKAYYFEGRGKYAEAEPLFLEALQVYKYVLTNYFPSLSEKEKGQFWNTMKNKFIAFNSFVINRMKENPQILGNLFDIQLFTKSLLFNTANKIRKRILASNDSVLIAQYRELISKKEFLYKLYSTPVAEVKKQGYNIDSIEAIANELEKQISLKSEDYKQSYERKKVTWKSIQTLLKPDEAAVEVVRFNLNKDRRFTDTVYYAFLIVTDQTEEHPDIVLLENGKELEEQYYAMYRNYMKKQIPDKESFGFFWQKLYDKLKDYKKIYFSPDGIYNKLNISTMLMPNGKYLLDEQQIHTLNSTQDILLGFYSKQEESNIYNSCELFGNPDFLLNPQKMKEIEQKYASLREMERSVDSTRSLSLQPLPGTEKEVKNISDFFKSKNWVVNIHTGDDAVKAAVKTVNNPRVLHIATHGLFLTDIKPDDKDILGMEGTRVIENPLLRSGLFFAGASKVIEEGFNPTGYDNGFLTAYEAQNMDLDRTELVVLSACETGLGEIRNGEGVFGLQRAFQQAGAKSVLMSLWKVNDEATQELMTIFYKEWVSGKTKREAFNTAQKKIRDKYKHPYFWGGFVMVGE